MNKNNLVGNGFTLIELAIAIIIIALIVAGISIGYNMINQAKLQSIIKDYQLYQTSFNTFVNKYNKIPGDMNSAFSMWGTRCAANSSICNGNGNGSIDYNTDVNLNEISQAWNHLYLAEMLNMYIPPVTNITGTPGVTAPASKIEAAGYVLRSYSSVFDASVTTLCLAAKDVTPSFPLLGSALVPGEALLIDQKMDDGLTDALGNSKGATTGIVRATQGSGMGAGACVNSSTGVYNMAQTSKACRLLIGLN
ncbi:prepilin-type N-terminal cleavage/methylation domain-containing protein [endosymbiont of Acanthamoeba sp. UWC8]|uniref:prepilin-type N-terminal cleavage/methylation domain-containing protein n=1 Tax=endosymbiont of Acanthamoeba sp. UWC8 TaxID=86106 RepID=UPI0004D1340D|nr:prepilin-type N-terminal cleavage/methylation domain-containing protein [endosymbiont of Acanthamoeba sp. UWC8]AIF80883.1 prepilin-type N-terminal cleavage/methylation domain-containing protein [endosymbiont of Acanthamoeba sp. UWC8]